MGYREISLKLPTDYTEEQLKQAIEQHLKIKTFSFQIDRKSLDARKKSNVHWQIRVAVLSDEIHTGLPEAIPELNIPVINKPHKAIVVGSGPAGFFCAFILQKAGIGTTIIERGAPLAKRTAGIKAFENDGRFNATCNYAFGEGGAGTFSDGKLTSRTKKISMEKRFIVSSYIQAGAPGEIAYMAHPHLGSDNIRKIVVNLRRAFIDLGGTILFETQLDGLTLKNDKVTHASIEAGTLEADTFIIAPGHSAYETYRMLIRSKVPFQTKPFAIGSRVEHPQRVINKAQWGIETLPGLKAAEYRLTARASGHLPVYTFCMCPGGTVVPATAYQNTNIVNGMSLYQRNGCFANAACVAAVDLGRLLRRHVTPLEALDWVEHLETAFYHYSHSYQAPFCTIRNFIERREPTESCASSYPLGLTPAALWEMLPAPISDSIRNGLKEFCRKIKGFETGTIMGLESKTSSPLQVVREKDYACAQVDNLYIVGEGSGFAGGIISSAADGVKAALSIIQKNS